MNIICRLIPDRNEKIHRIFESHPCADRLLRGVLARSVDLLSTNLNVDYINVSCGGNKEAFERRKEKKIARVRKKMEQAKDDLTDLEQQTYNDEVPVIMLADPISDSREVELLREELREVREKTIKLNLELTRLKDQEAKTNELRAHDPNRLHGEGNAYLENLERQLLMTQDELKSTQLKNEMLMEVSVNDNSSSQLDLYLSSRSQEIDTLIEENKMLRIRMEHLKKDAIEASERWWHEYHQLFEALRVMHIKEDLPFRLIKVEFQINRLRNFSL